MTGRAVTGGSERVEPCTTGQQGKLLMCPTPRTHFKFFHTTYPESRSNKDVFRRTIEMPQRARLLKGNCCLKVHNAHQKLLSPISG